MKPEVREVSIEEKEWLERRRSGIGGSDVAGILGLSKWSTPLSVYLDKKDEATYDTESGPMRWGKLLEPVIADEFARESGKRVQRFNSLISHSEYDYLIGNIDRKVVGERAPLEVKTSSAYKLEDWVDKIPNDYMLQVQHYMSVGNFEYAYLAVLIGGQTFKWYRVPRDNSLIEDIIIPACKNFWNDHVLAGVPPAPSESDIDRHLLGNLYSDPSSNEIELDQDVTDLSERYMKVNLEIKELESVRTQLGNLICDKVGRHEKATCPGYKISWKPQFTKRIDTKRLKSDEPGVYEKYLKESESRPLRIKEIRESK
jgi:putative phage-type endonuclease